MPRNPSCNKCEELTNKNLKNRCVWGNGKKGLVMIVGQNPGTHEDIQGMPFVGPAGKLLRKILGSRVDMCYITNVVKCYYKETPSLSMVKNCLPYLIEEILDVKPKVIVTLGEVASRALIRKQKIKDISFIPQFSTIKGIEDIPIFATYHPAAALRKEGIVDLIVSHISTTIDSAFKYVSGEAQVKEFDHKVVENAEEIIELIEKYDKFAIDIETSSLNEYEDGARIKSISLSPAPYKAIVIPWDEAYWGDDFDIVKSAIFTLLTQNKYTLIGHNIKFDLRWLMKEFNLDDIACDIEDTIIMHHLISEEEKHSLSALAYKYTDVGGYDREVYRKGVSKVEGEELYRYNAMDCDVTYRLYEIFFNKLAKEGMFFEPYRSLLIPATKVLLLIERYGAPADKNYLLYAYKKLKSAFDDLMEEVRSDKIVKELFKEGDFNPFSHKHMLKLCLSLFDEEDLPKTDKGAPSFNKEFLEDYKDEWPLLEKIYILRKANVLMSHIKKQYIPSIQSDGRIHPTFTLFVARSGRTASEHPNLQNLMSGEFLGIRIRNMIYAPKGFVLLSADFSLHELRVAAALSKDENLTRILNDGLDVHSYMASKIFGIDYNEFVKGLESGNEEYEKMRKRAKSVVFGVMYGMTPTGLSRRLKISKKEAERYIDEFFLQFPKLKMWINYIVEKARKTKKVTTPFGRKRTFEWDPDFERKAINTPIQSVASDLLLLGLVNLVKRLRERKFESFPILEVHDEILLLVKENELEDVLYLTKGVLENPNVDFLGDVKLKVDFSVGKRWGELEELSIK